LDRNRRGRRLARNAIMACDHKGRPSATALESNITYMPELVYGRFRTSADRLPAARQRHGVAMRSGLLQHPLATRLIALFVCLRLVGYACENGRAVVGGGRWAALRRSFLPFLRYWESFLPLVLTNPDASPPRWFRRVDRSGLDRLLELRADNTPVMLAAPHLGFSPSVLCYALSGLGVPVAINTVAPNLFRRIPGVEAFDPDEAVRSFLALRNGAVLLYGADVAGPGVPCQLFGRFVSLPRFFAEVAAQTGAAIVVASCSGFRSGNLRINLDEPIFSQGRPADLVTQEIATRMELAIRPQPFEWFPPGPFLAHMSFSQTGQIPTLVGVLSPAAADQGRRCTKRLGSYRGFAVGQALVEEGDLPTLLARLRSERYELLVLVGPEAINEIDDMPAVINWFFRLPTDWVAFDPKGCAAPGVPHPLTSFSLSLIKTRLLEELVRRDVRRLDTKALKLAARTGWHCHRIPTTYRLLEEIKRLNARGFPVSDLIRE